MTTYIVLGEHCSRGEEQDDKDHPHGSSLLRDLLCDCSLLLDNYHAKLIRPLPPDTSLTFLLLPLLRFACARSREEIAKQEDLD